MLDEVDRIIKKITKKKDFNFFETYIFNNNILVINKYVHQHHIINGMK